MRRLSAYTHDDLLLGVFGALESAERGRDAYVKAILVDGPDPHAEQLYHRVSPEDVRILSDLPAFDVWPEPRVVFVVVSYSEAMGQGCIKLEAIHGDLERANEAAVALEAEYDDEGFAMALRCFVEEVEVDRLSDGGGGRVLR